MLMVEFWKQKLIKINSEIQDAELEKNFKRVARLESEKVEAEKRLKELEG
ncbi:MAG: hypothetical protein LKF87_03890 [Clostridium tyrobutyricum]|jgi:hypothetical protein|nr:hypothetical protein [Clostridium tyrobutyricum]MCH4199255.1 hypothetical protein [Clostridium tyrobutyricum]MCH4236587.1 hypothetical protein [Clostridium tyrobutyricum]MCH4258097.1 hypothetical protein [Clostridium tyrobutyricum]MCI1239136.1 hypothetical protein [Clostridium tyrobutyricum]MCI1651392.1 hypothetical protein [Clostridium tyrobutyricum]